jgi:hypothetical protein
MSRQEVRLNLIILTPQGKPLFILENTSQEQPSSPAQLLAQFQTQADPLSDKNQDEGPSLSELVDRRSEHLGGQTISELLSKEEA